MILFPNCKINLGLHILRKRADSFHDLETVFYPAPLQDALEIIQSEGSKNDVSLEMTGLPIDARKEDNICVKAYKLLNKDFPLPSVKIHLHKVVPAGAGLGGGSADGAFALLLLNKKFNLGLTEEQLMRYALQLGSDCPFFIKNVPCFATGRGEILTEIALDLSPYKMVLVNPGIHISTGWAFSQVTPNDQRESVKELIQLPITEWRKKLTNDFEAPILKQYPQIKEVKDQLYQQGAMYVSMTGTGSSVFALFDKTSIPSLPFPKEYFIRGV